MICRLISMSYLPMSFRCECLRKFAIGLHSGGLLRLAAIRPLPPSTFLLSFHLLNSLSQAAPFIELINLKRWDLSSASALIAFPRRAEMTVPLLD